ncbi:hypothetical protein JOF56_008653 [Kibdelosporangium banguiense]|uniref:Uncharacterized protein n=1 Tax=Kibdelosporangium banguiense TaxID=1365924 RepID=A0ABS4TWB3_9PSEU|nr:hypothetical protein [Kibdelosporangium banguiense]
MSRARARLGRGLENRLQDETYRPAGVFSVVPAH